MQKSLLSVLVMLVATAAVAAEDVKPAKQINPVGVDELASVTLGLIVVLGLIFALAWLYRRYGNIATLNRSAIQIVGGVSLGSREKAILLEVEGTRLLVGVAAGQVNTLHVFSAEEKLPPSFADTLQQQNLDIDAAGEKSQ